jgi:hypothetical protein
MKKILILCLPIFLSACLKATVITSNEQSITIDIRNTGLTTGEMITGGTKIANEHCSKFGKKTNLENTTGVFGTAHTAYFSCK